MSFIDRFNLYILNLDQNCSGEITWKRNEMESVIDFAITNSKMYGDFNKMTIDDNWDIIDISDHCLITIQININRNNIKSTNKKTCIIFNKKSDNAIEKFTEYVSQKMENSDQPMNIELLNNIISEAEENTLKVKLFKNIKNNEKIEPMWVTKNMKKEIAVKRIINKKRRKTTNGFTALKTEK